MVTLETSSRSGDDTQTSKSQWFADEEWMGKFHNLSTSPSPEATYYPSTLSFLGLGHLGLRTFEREADLASLKRTLADYLTPAFHVSGTTGDNLGKQRETLKQEVGELLVGAGTENWDGEGALALQHDTVAVAQELIDRFPHYIGAPDVAATPHGEVDFDWVISREVMLTVSVGPSTEIAFAGLFQGTRLNGSEPWNGVLPHFVQCCFERLREAQSA